MELRALWIHLLSFEINISFAFISQVFSIEFYSLSFQFSTIENINNFNVESKEPQATVAWPHNSNE